MAYDKEQSQGHFQSMMEAFEAMLLPDSVGVINSEKYDEMYGLTSKYSSGKLAEIRKNFFEHGMIGSSFGGNRIITDEAEEELNETIIQGRALLIHGINHESICFINAHNNRITTNYDFEDRKPIIDEIFSSHYEAIATASTDYEKLTVIAKTVRSLHVGHFFPDGNGRLNMPLVMNRLLCDAGFAPAILPNGPEAFGGHRTAKELVTDMIVGMSNFAKEAPSLPEEYSIKINTLLQSEKEQISSVYDAASYGFTDLMPTLIERKMSGHDIIMKNNEGESAFFVACENNHLDTVSWILEKSNNADEYDIYGNTALINACTDKNPDLIKLLLDQGADINKANRNGYTPLMMACKQGNVEIIKTLLEYENIDVNKEMPDGFTALMIACEKGNIDVVRTLLEHKNIDVNQTMLDGSTVFMIACNNNHKEVAALLLENGFDINNEVGLYGEFTSLMVAAYLGKQDIVDLLLTHIEDPAYIRRVADKEKAEAFCSEKEIAAPEEVDKLFGNNAEGIAERFAEVDHPQFREDMSNAISDRHHDLLRQKYHVGGNQEGRSI